ncbi:hypothetical protein GFH30_08885 [Acinetobacter wanghuae]|uniref:DUF4393 domain-containing protein n=1 Tax=Acinetobacter wanghuae TaxID=2662362 RepID=A0A5Q0P314_9GAMM|nr:hypothetical protein [Acinetobacter wanghuae]MQW91788.1 hypothetical protein [Acinetobacter wanghuae]QGA11499.1 hypothetical protein GFH30_08885 [Acinetobacter wanghuae]
MSIKKNISSSALQTTENITDEMLFKAANTFFEDAIKSIPFASLITSSIETYTQFRVLKEQKQLLAFIQEAETTDVGFIENFFKDKNNTELGLEILGILDQTYLEHQARMIGRITLLLKNGDISKNQFDQYTYIVSHLNNHLISLIEHLYLVETNKEDPEFKYDVKNPNMELVSFGFLIQVPSQLYPGGTQVAQFKKTDHFNYFYDNIFKD